MKLNKHINKMDKIFKKENSTFSTSRCKLCRIGIPSLTRGVTYYKGIKDKHSWPYCIVCYDLVRILDRILNGWAPDGL